MAARLTPFPFEFADRTSESSTEDLTQVQHGEVSVHTGVVGREAAVQGQQSAGLFSTQFS